MAVNKLPESFCNVEYIGRNAESYCDMKEHAQIETVTCPDLAECPELDGDRGCL